MVGFGIAHLVQKRPEQAAAANEEVTIMDDHMSTTIESPLGPSHKILRHCPYRRSNRFLVSLVVGVYPLRPISRVERGAFPIQSSNDSDESEGGKIIPD